MIYQDGKPQSAGNGGEDVMELVRTANRELLDEIRGILVSGPSSRARGAPAPKEDAEAMRQLAREMASSQGKVEANFETLGRSARSEGDGSDDDVINMLSGGTNEQGS